MTKYIRNGLIGKNQYGFMSYSDRFYSKVLLPNENGCMEWIGSKSTGGYGLMSFYGKLRLAHRISYELHYGLFDKNLDVLHKCDNPICVNPDHLWLGTDKDNSLDCRIKGRDTCFKKVHKPVANNRGINSKKAKLDDNKVRDIKERLRRKETIASIARYYLISPSIVSGIKHGYRWSHVQNSCEGKGIVWSE